MDKKSKIVIMVLSMLVAGMMAFIVTDKLIIGKNDGTENTITTNKNDKMVSNNEIAEDKDKEDESKDKTQEKEKKESNTTNTSDAVKSALKDKSWLKKNIYVQEDEGIIDVDNVEQDISFIVCKSGAKPIVVVQVLAEEARYAKIILVSYSNGNVTSTKINEGHIYHGAYSVDANKCVVRTIYMHGGSEATIYHSVTDGKLKFMGMYGSEIDSNSEAESDSLIYYINKKSLDSDSEDVSEQQYEEYKASLNESKYNFVDIGTELTDSNIDKYIK
ncbi:MAG: hypothetical protein IJH12_07120 [Clostridia bacterium]|nr:hypothetical protein [Clostridia bacterium]